MIGRNDGERNNGRPFSSTNPFRSALNDNSLQEYKNDKQFVEWANENGVNSPPYISNSGSRHNSNFSFVDSIEEDEERSSLSQNGRVHSPLATGFSAGSPPIASNNPFLDDVMADNRNRVTKDECRQDGPRRSQNERGNSNKSYPTARDEKERLRQTYMESTNLNAPAESRNHRSRSRGNDAAPPSYQEAAGTSAGRSQYPREKEHRSRHNSRSNHSKSSSSHRRSHYPDGERERSERDHDSERRHRHGSSKSSSSKSKRKSQAVIPKNVDTIDKLDVTGLFGGSFHHDGPFDAVTPHRNKDKKAAPVMAFPADGPNSTIGGASSKPSALNEVFGRDEYADERGDLYRQKAPNPNYRRSVYMSGMMSSSSDTMDAIKNRSEISQFDTKVQTAKISGPTTIGLGSTTFLDGAPASDNAIRDDIIQHAHKSRGIQRHKSLSQKFNIGRSNSEMSHGTSSPTFCAQSGARASSNNTFDDNDDDIYLSRDNNASGSRGITFDENTKKESSGNKFLRRVKSLKVSRK